MSWVENATRLGCSECLTAIEISRYRHGLTAYVNAHLNAEGEEAALLAKDEAVKSFLSPQGQPTQGQLTSCEEAPQRTARRS